MSRLKSLTPERAWEEYVSMPVELFISCFLAEGITDITEMCKSHAYDLPLISDLLYTIDQLDLISRFLKEYINDYIEEIGGYDKLNLFTEDELDEIDEKQVDNLFKIILTYTSDILN